MKLKSFRGLCPAPGPPLLIYIGDIYRHVATGGGGAYTPFPFFKSKIYLPFSYINFYKNTKSICFWCLALPSHTLNLLRALKLLAS